MLGPTLTPAAWPWPPSPPPMLPAAGDSWRPCPTWQALAGSLPPRPRRPPRLGWAVFPILPPSRPRFVPFSPSQQLWAGWGVAAVTALQTRSLKKQTEAKGWGGDHHTRTRGLRWEDRVQGLTYPAAQERSLKAGPWELSWESTGRLVTHTHGLLGETAQLSGGPGPTGETQPSSRGPLDLWGRHSPALGGAVDRWGRHCPALGGP